MKKVIISCKMLEFELNKVLEKAGEEYEVIWLEKALHETPARLREELLRILTGLDARGDVDRVYMTLGDCGGATKGLSAGKNFDMIYPRMDDCITLLLGAPDIRRELNQQGVYFLSDSWLTGTRNIITEYEYTKEKYDEETAAFVMETMLKNYKKLGLLDTGAGDVAALFKATAPFAREMHLEQVRIAATLEWLSSLLSAAPENTDRFVYVAPGESAPDLALRSSLYM